MTILQTERMTVASITLEDASFFVKLLNSPDWLRFIGDRHVKNEDESRRYLQESFLSCYVDHGFGYYVVRTRDGDEPLGICGFLKKPSLENPDFGFALLPEFYGQGLAFESCKAVLDFGIETFGFSQLDAVTLTANQRSIRLLEKLEFQKQGPVTDARADCSKDGPLLLYRRES